MQRRPLPHRPRLAARGFNSLFKMHTASHDDADNRRTGFNSLFEMRDYYVTLPTSQRLEGFNSLFEMQQFGGLLTMR